MKRFKSSFALAALSAAMTFGGCTTAATNVGPPITFTPSNGVLQVSVGTVNFGGTGAGLNVLETFRSASGFTAVPINTATIGGPAGFSGPAGSSDPGAGSNPVPLGAALNSFQEGPNFGIIFASADGFGIGPPSSSSTAANPFPFQPQFLDKVAGAQPPFTAPPTPLPSPTCAPTTPPPPPPPPAQHQFYGQPPAYPTVGGILSSGTGFPQGFYLLALSMTPPAGGYTLTVSFSQNGVSSSSSASASLSSSALLPVISPPSYAPDAAGGGMVSVVAPSGVTEVMVNIIDLGPSACGASEPVATTATALFHGSGSAMIPDGTFASGDNLALQAIGFDYNDFELGPPTNVQQSPTLPAHADLTVSAQGLATQMSVARKPLTRYRRPLIRH